jgi:hypothetical protein
MPPVSTDDKELSQVPDSPIAGNFRALPHQNEPRQLAIDPDQKRVPARIAPVKRKVGIIESAVRSELYIKKFAEIVDI